MEYLEPDVLAVNHCIPDVLVTRLELATTPLKVECSTLDLHEYKAEARRLELRLARLTVGSFNR